MLRIQGGSSAKRDRCIFCSGAAGGAEAEFGAAAERYGIEEVNFTFEGHRDARSRGIRVLTAAELAEGDVSLAYVSRLMHRRYPTTPLLRRVLQSIWHQVGSGQEVYVVGCILQDGTVKGGAGWGAELAKLCNKPLFAFDQESGTWSSWQGLRMGRNPSSKHRPHRLHRHGDPLPLPKRSGCDRGFVPA